MAYTGSVDLISGIRPKNGGTFPLVDAKDVYIDDETRLPEALSRVVSFDGQILPEHPTQNQLTAAFKTFFISHGGKVSAAKEYVQNGLIAMWDAEENAGWATHDAAPTLWKNLVSDNYHWVLSATNYSSGFFEIGTDYLKILSGQMKNGNPSTPNWYAANAKIGYNKSSDDNISPIPIAIIGHLGACLDTTECSATDDDRRGVAVFYEPSPTPNDTHKYHKSVLASQTRIWFGSGNAYIEASGINSVAMNFGDENRIYLNGEQSSSKTTISQNVYATVIGGYSPAAADGVKIHNLRIYNRVLDEDEIALNAAIDAQRFGSGAETATTAESLETATSEETSPATESENTEGGEEGGEENGGEE